MYGINWSNKAKKQFRRIDKKNQSAIIDAVDELRHFPNTRNVVALTNHECGYRMRIGSYRILFDASVKMKIIEIQHVKKRDEQTY